MEILLLSERTSEPQSSVIHSLLMLETWFRPQFLPGVVCLISWMMPLEALNDAMQAQLISPIWHIASYLQAVALSALGMETEAQSALKEGTLLEAKRNSAAGQK